MADRINVVPAELRRAATEHRHTAEQLSDAGSADRDVLSSLESLGPIFGELRDAGRALLDERRACYQQQAAAHADLADKLSAAADAWEMHDTDAAVRLRDVGGDGAGTHP